MLFFGRQMERAYRVNILRLPAGDDVESHAQSLAQYFMVNNVLSITRHQHCAFYFFLYVTSEKLEEMSRDLADEGVMIEWYELSADDEEWPFVSRVFATVFPLL
jgi:hypothetical protein